MALTPMLSLDQLCTPWNVSVYCKKIASAQFLSLLSQKVIFLLPRGNLTEIKKKKKSTFQTNQIT